MIYEKSMRKIHDCQILGHLSLNRHHIREIKILPSQVVSSSGSTPTSLTLPPFYQQISGILVQMFWYFVHFTPSSGTGTFVLCETSITYNSLDIQDTNLDCKILNDNSLPPAQSSKLTNLLQVVEFYENIGILYSAKKL